jgi:hypothetical protein
VPFVQDATDQAFLARRATQSPERRPLPEMRPRNPRPLVESSWQDAAKAIRARRDGDVQIRGPESLGQACGNPHNFSRTTLRRPASMWSAAACRRFADREGSTQVCRPGLPRTSATTRSPWSSGALTSRWKGGGKPPHSIWTCVRAASRRKQKIECRM